MRAILLTIGLSLSLMSCGDIHLKKGNSIALNDPVPVGATLLSQGSAAFDQSGVTLQTTAQIYRATSGQIILRLTGYSSSTANVFVFLETSATNQFFNTVMSLTSGNVNFYTNRSLGASETATRVVFRKTSSIVEPELGSANLLPM